MTGSGMTITTLFGSAPIVSSQMELDEIRGKVCAVEFGTQELLGFGDTWADALNDVAAKGNSEKQFYRYSMPQDRFDFEELLRRMRQMARDHLND